MSLEPEWSLENILSQRPNADQKYSGEIILGVEVRVTNIGNTHVDVWDGEIEITDINPNHYLLKRDVPEKTLLEPGESDQIYFRAFTLDKITRTIQVRTSVKAPT